MLLPRRCRYEHADAGVAALLIAASATPGDAIDVAAIC